MWNASAKPAVSFGQWTAETDMWILYIRYEPLGWLREASWISKRCADQKALMFRGVGYETKVVWED